MQQSAPRARDRNRRSILEAARQVLVDDPTASMDEIALAAGMVRRTVYGHFPSRCELVAALVRAGAEEFVAGLAEVDVRSDRPEVELAATVLGTWETARRFGPLIELARHEADDVVVTALEPFSAQVAALIGHGQRRGVFTNDLDPTVLARLVDAVAQALLSEQHAGRWDGGAADVARTQLLMLGLPVDAADEAVAAARRVRPAR